MEHTLYSWICCLTNYVCFKVGAGEDVVSSWVREKLWQAAGDKLGAVPPSESSTANCNPDVSKSGHILYYSVGPVYEEG